MAADIVAQVIGLLQKQLQTEASRDWPLACIPRPWTLPPKEDGSDAFASATKHAFPAIVVPNPISQKSKPMTPELYVSVYADQEFEVRGRFDVPAGGGGEREGSSMGASLT